LVSNEVYPEDVYCQILTRLSDLNPTEKCKKKKELSFPLVVLVKQYINCHKRALCWEMYGLMQAVGKCMLEEDSGPDI
jgi:hypothetical protein